MNKIMPNRSFSPRTFMGDHGISIDYNFEKIVAPKPWKPQHSRSASNNAKFVEESLFEEAGNEIQTIILHSFNIYDESVEQQPQQQSQQTTYSTKPNPTKPKLVSFLSNSSNNINNNKTNNSISSTLNNNNNNCKVNKTTPITSTTTVNSNGSSVRNKIAINVDHSNLRNIEIVDSKNNSNNSNKATENIYNNKCKLETNNNNNNNHMPTIISPPTTPTTIPINTILTPTSTSSITSSTETMEQSSSSASASITDNKTSSSPSYNGRNNNNGSGSGSGSLLERCNSNDNFLLSQSMDNIIENYSRVDSLDHMMKIPFFSHQNNNNNNNNNANNINSNSYSPCFSGIEPLTPPTRTHNPITMNQAFTDHDLHQEGVLLGLLSVSPSLEYRNEN